MNAPRDDNRITTLLGVDSTLFRTPTTAAVNPTTHEVLVRASVPETPPTDSTKLPTSLVLSYNGSDQLTQIDKVINGVTYRKTLTYTGDNLTGVSIWTQI
jgi:hypothetical protein